MYIYIHIFSIRAYIYIYIYIEREREIDREREREIAANLRARTCGNRYTVMASVPSTLSRACMDYIVSC